MNLNKANTVILYCVMIMSLTGGMSAAFVMLTVMSQLGEEIFLMGGMVDMLIGILLVKYVTEKTVARKWLLLHYRWVIAASIALIPLVVVGSLHDPAARYLLMCTVGVTAHFITSAMMEDCLHRQMSKDPLTTYGQKLSRYSDMGRLAGMSIAYYITTLDIDFYTLGVLVLAVSSLVDTYALHVRVNVDVVDEEPVSEETSI